MKQIITVLFLLAVSISYSQDAIDTLAKESCECIQNKKLELNKLSSEILRSEFVACFFTSYSKHADALNEIEKLEFNDEQQMSKFGEKVAMKMVNYCPDYIIALGTAFNESKENVTEKFLAIEGELTEINTAQFVTLKVKDKNKRMHNLILLDYFDTASLFTDGLIKKRDTIIVNYSEVELFDPQLKEFRYYKVITGLEKK